jgi:hypothetical protein
MLSPILLNFFSIFYVYNEPLADIMTALAGELMHLDKVSPHLCATRAAPIEINPHILTCLRDGSLFLAEHIKAS